MNTPEIVHILRYGSALCGLEGLPRDWPDGHLWTEEGDPEVNCEGCLAACKGKTL